MGGSVYGKIDNICESRFLCRIANIGVKSLV